MLRPLVRCQTNDDHWAIQLPGAQVSFLWSRDRWQHAIHLNAAPTRDSDPLIASIEGDPTPDAPDRVVSPVFQELHQHDPHPDSGAAVSLLLTGHAVKLFFSSAVRIGLDPLTFDRGGIEFDTATRCQAPVRMLAASYLVGLGPGSLLDAGSQRIAWTLPPGGADLLELTAEPPTRLALEAAEGKRCRVLAVAQIAAGLTHRFRYRWSWAVRSSRTR